MIFLLWYVLLTNLKWLSWDVLYFLVLLKKIKFLTIACSLISKISLSRNVSCSVFGKKAVIRGRTHMWSCLYTEALTGLLPQGCAPSSSSHFPCGKPAEVLSPRHWMSSPLQAALFLFSAAFFLPLLSFFISFTFCSVFLHLIPSVFSFCSFITSLPTSSAGESTNAAENRHRDKRGVWPPGDTPVER